MAEPQLKKSLGEAVVSAGSVVEQGRKVGSIVPRRTEEGQQRVRAAVSAATESLRAVAAHGRQVDILAGRFGGYHYFRMAEGGHERPARVFRTLAEARRHSRDEESELRRHILERFPNARPDAMQPGDYTGVSDPRLAPAGSAMRLSVDVAGWLNSRVLGDTLAGRFARSPPMVTEDPSRYFRFEGALSGGVLPAGIYIPGTNHIMLDSERVADMAEAGRREVIAHEMFHYASYLGGGHTVRWRDERGRPVVLRSAEMDFLKEGCTELMAQQLTRSHGFDPGSVSYGAETTLAFYLQQIAGPNVLGAAYLSGDFTEVRRAVDAKLGAGTFDRMAQNGSGSGALYIIRESMQARGLGAELARWDANPIVRTAGAVD